MSFIYEHTQSTPATTWTITHNMGGPVVSDAMVTVNGVVVKILPSSVIYTDDNTLTLTFSTAVSGKARLIGPWQTPVITGPGSIG
jgi:hypothetical protein